MCQLSCFSKKNQLLFALILVRLDRYIPLRVLLNQKILPKTSTLEWTTKNATQTQVQLINPAIQLESTTEDDIITLLLGCMTKVLKLAYDTLTNQVSEVLLKLSNVTKDVVQRITQDVNMPTCEMLCYKWITTDIDMLSYT